MIASAWGDSWGDAWGNSWGARGSTASFASSGGYGTQYRRKTISREQRDNERERRRTERRIRRKVLVELESREGGMLSAEAQAYARQVTDEFLAGMDPLSIDFFTMVQRIVAEAARYQRMLADAEDEDFLLLAA